MSTTQILEELPNLNPADLETIYRRAIELHQGQTVIATPELLAAIDEADESFVKEGGVSLTVVKKLAAMEALWNDLCRDESQIPVPDWHKQILDERQRQIDSGEARFIDWETAKARIRQRIG
jgi:hypothetical protein